MAKQLKLALTLGQVRRLLAMVEGNGVRWNAIEREFRRALLHKDERPRFKPGDLKKCAVDSRRIWIGFSSDGAEIVATYTSQREVDAFREVQEEGGEIVTGPWVRAPKRKR